MAAASTDAGVFLVDDAVFSTHEVRRLTSEEDELQTAVQPRAMDEILYIASVVAQHHFPVDVVNNVLAFAGVLLVFCYLIVPSVAAMLYSERIGPRLAIGWTMGTVVSALGVYFSLWLDLPTGATIVCTFGGVLVLMALARPLVRAGAAGR